jgi:hypothetical protein
MDVADIKQLIETNKNIDYLEINIYNGEELTRLNYITFYSKNESVVFILIYHILQKKNYKEIFNYKKHVQNATFVDILALKNYFNAFKLVHRHGGIICNTTFWHSLARHFSKQEIIKYIFENDSNIVIYDDMIYNFKRLNIDNFKIALAYNKYLTLDYLNIFTHNFNKLPIEAIYEILNVYRLPNKCIYCYMYKNVDEKIYKQVIYRCIIDGYPMNCTDSKCPIDESYKEIFQHYISAVDFQLNKYFIKHITKLIINILFDS